MKLILVFLMLCSLVFASKECPTDCTLDYTPICGHSSDRGYKTFSNPCHMDVENNCNKGNFKFHKAGVCESTGSH